MASKRSCEFRARAIHYRKLAQLDLGDPCLRQAYDELADLMERKAALGDDPVVAETRPRRSKT